MSIASALRARPAWILTATLIGAAFLVPVASASAQTDPSDKPTAPNGPALPIEGIPDSTRLAMDALTQSSSAARISQQTWDDSRKMVLVHYVGSDNGLSAQVAKYLPQKSFELVRDQYYHSELSEESKRLAKAAIAAGVDIALASATEDNSGVQLAVRGPESSVSGAVRSTISDVSKDSKYPIQVTFNGPTLGVSGRLSDSAPFYGGGRMFRQINSNTARVCSNAFKVRNASSGATAMLTAAHCGVDGTQWFAAGTGNSLGTLGPSNAGGTDMRKLTGQPYSATIWLGEITSSDAQSIKGKFTGVVGDTGICVDGSFTGQRCGMQVVAVDQYYCATGDVCRDHATWIRSLSGSGVIQEGDSGGPVVKGTSGGALAGGVISAYVSSYGQNGTTHYTQAACVNGTSGPCYSDSLYAPVDYFLNGNSGWSVATG